MNSFNPLDYPLSFTHPERIAPSTWLAHTPFAMFLVDLLRPAIIVELGTQYGVSYCAFCQAVKALDLDTNCYAVDTWQGDAHAGGYGNEVINDLKRHHDPLYSTFSHLVQSTFDDALKTFTDGTIDLLHIDGYHTYEAVKHDFTNWLPKLSEQGVILFHDISVKENNFGVWRLWDELKVQYPHFDFPHGYGLGVLVVGKKYPPALNILLKTSDDLSVIKDFFLQLGSGMEREYDLMVQAAEKERALQRIINSHGWKFVRVLRKFRLWFLPVNSSRERFVRSLFRGIKNANRRA
jgi:hypothetical protein